MWHLVCAISSAAVPTSPGAPPEPTAEEAARLAAREIVVRADLTGDGGGVVGLMDVKAEPAAVWRAILDFEARVGEVSGIQSVERYDVTDTSLGATWKLKMMGIGASFSMKYTLAPADHFLYYTLDPSKPGDLKAGAGSYQLVGIGDVTRVVYRSEMESGAPVPAFVKRWLAVDALEDQLDSIRGRSEAGR